MCLLEAKHVIKKHTNVVRKKENNIRCYRKKILSVIEKNFKCYSPPIQ